MSDGRQTAGPTPEEVTKHVRTLAAVFGRPVTVELLDGYWRGLQRVPADRLGAAVDQLLQHARFMPSPAELAAAARVESAALPPRHIPPPIPARYRTAATTG